MRFVFQSLFVGLLSLAVGGCANIATIDRTTALPASGSKFGKAIHLDVQQRLAFVNANGQFCPEPSPDALAAYSSALGLSASASAQDVISAAANSNFATQAAQIGLRTQTITTTRDKLFFQCLSFINGAIGPAHVATSFARLQDQTTVALLFEQVTGPVFTSQAALTSRASGESDTVGSSSSRALDAVRDESDRANQRVAAADEEIKMLQGRATELASQLAKVQGEKGKLETEVERIETEIAAIPTPPAVLPEGEVPNEENSNRRSQLNTDRSRLGSEIAELTGQEGEFDALQKDVQGRLEIAVENQKRLSNRADELSETLNTLAQNPNSTIASASGRTSGLATFSDRASTSKLSASAQVEAMKMLGEVALATLAKDYTPDACISIISLPTASTSTDQREFCQEFINAEVELRTANAKMATAKATFEAAQAKEAAAKSKLAAAEAEKRTAEIDKELRRIFSPDSLPVILTDTIETLEECFEDPDNAGKVNQAKIPELIAAAEKNNLAFVNANKMTLQGFQEISKLMPFLRSNR